MAPYGSAPDHRFSKDHRDSRPTNPPLWKRTASNAPSSLAKRRKRATLSATSLSITAKSTLDNKIALRLEIPKDPAPTTQQKRVVAIRKAAAARWRPKLQRDFPSEDEVKRAYTGKLLRHYVGTGPEAAPVLPPIKKSARVMTLLRSFPQSLSGLKSKHAESVKALLAQKCAVQRDKEILKRNLKIINDNDNTTALAARCFGKMTEWHNQWLTGFADEDLRKEEKGAENKLPEWKKWKTGRFAD
ncbi:hypothetical protein P154DRAFT_599549 [Amniculicola lignicola CBS 123094]|uniref:Uncharacterized protein n=1 Tax=Amniculicola lignicola CBS 123094 TaxID=1392246 RepID=A0A6A5WH56_9PLEO|nr:hypothetical protein P154DRAFT_599549 [Amniculicola lignicola CBS 123094]